VNETFTNLSAASIDLARASLTTSHPMELDVTGD
jgi:hypothetical protein